MSVFKVRNVAFIGTGIMGAPIAGHILDAGFNVTVYNRTRAKAEALLAHRLDEVADDLEVDVGLQQRQPDLAQAGLDVLLVERLDAAEGLEDAGEPVRETFEHVASLARREESAAEGGRSGRRRRIQPRPGP